MLFNNHAKKLIRKIEANFPQIESMYETGMGFYRVVEESRGKPLIGRSIGKDYLNAFYIGCLEMLMRGTVGANNLTKLGVTANDLALYIAHKSNSIKNSPAASHEFLTELEEARSRPKFEHFWRLGLSFGYGLVIDQEADLKDTIGIINKLEHDIKEIMTDPKNPYFE